MLNKFNKILSVSAIASMLLMPINTLALSRDETVYTKITSDKTNTIVSEHIKNDSKDSTITDYTNLSDIKNTNGNETFTLDNNKLTWESNGKDIYYQGNSDKELPINLDITYKLNGTEMNPNDMVGKDGKVTITLKYTNKDMHKVNGNVLYTPYLITVGTAIKTDNNSNVEVTNGKVSSNGNTNIVAAIASPGLYESLNIDKFKSLDTVTISYETNSFEKTSIYSIATAKLVDNIDLNQFIKLDSIYNKVDTLSNSTIALVNASKKIYNGMNEYNNKFTEYGDNMNKIASYSNKFNDGLKGIQKELDNGSKELSASLTEYSAGINDVATGVNSIANGASNLDTGVQGLVSIMNGMIDSYNKTTDQINALSNKGSQSVSKIMDTTQIDAEIMQLQTSNKTIAGVMANFENAIMKVNTYTDSNSMDKDNIAIVTYTLNSISTGSTKLVNGSKKLNTEVKEELVPKTKALVDGIGKKFSTLQNGINEFANQYETFNDGVNKLNGATKQLSTASNTIEDGMMQLSNGLDKYNNEGISALVKFINGDLKDNAYKVNELIKLSNNASSFSNSKINGCTKYITIIEK